MAQFSFMTLVLCVSTLRRKNLSKADVLGQRYTCDRDGFIMGDSVNCHLEKFESPGRWALGHICRSGVVLGSCTRYGWYHSLGSDLGIPLRRESELSAST